MITNMELKIKTVKMIDCSDWDDFVSKVYGRPYCFQQQDDCKPRGIFRFSVPCEVKDNFDNDTIPEMINGEKMGVSFEAWKTRDPKEPIKGDPSDPRFEIAQINKYSRYPRASESDINLFWERNFYPDFQMVANDLHKKGLLEAGNYVLDIDW